VVEEEGTAVAEDAAMQLVDAGKHVVRIILEITRLPRRA
jgi:hypothetical protein